jgi:hypothetical protein
VLRIIARRRRFDRADAKRGTIEAATIGRCPIVVVELIDGYV